MSKILKPCLQTTSSLKALTANTHTHSKVLLYSLLRGKTRLKQLSNIILLAIEASHQFAKAFKWAEQTSEEKNHM